MNTGEKGDNMTNIPKDLKYTQEHEWIKLEGDTATIGITDYAQSQLTDIVFIELPEKGKEYNKGQTIAHVESVKSVSEVFSPVSCAVTEVNSNLSESPEKLNASPYSDGWIARIEIKNKEELDSLLSPEKYQELIEPK